MHRGMRPSSTFNIYLWYFALELYKLSRQFLKFLRLTSIFRILHSTDIKIKLIVFLHFIKKREKGVSSLKHDVFVFSSHFMCVTRIMRMSSVPLLATPLTTRQTTSYAQFSLRLNTHLFVA